MSGVDSLRNLGPKSVEMLAEVGITTADQLRELGSVEAYRRMKFAFGNRVSLNALWAIEAGLRGIAWRQLTADDKAALKAALHDPE